MAERKVSSYLHKKVSQLFLRIHKEKGFILKDKFLFYKIFDACNSRDFTNNTSMLQSDLFLQ